MNADVYGGVLSSENKIATLSKNFVKTVDCLQPSIFLVYFFFDR